MPASTNNRIQPSLDWPSLCKFSKLSIKYIVDLTPHSLPLATIVLLLTCEYTLELEQPVSKSL